MKTKQVLTFFRLDYPEKYALLPQQPKPEPPVAAEAESASPVAAQMPAQAVSDTTGEVKPHPAPKLQQEVEKPYRYVAEEPLPRQKKKLLPKLAIACGVGVIVSCGLTVGMSGMIKPTPAPAPGSMAEEQPDSQTGTTTGSKAETTSENTQEVKPESTADKKPISSPIFEASKPYNQSVAAGAKHIVALRNDGTVVAAGDNTYGQCDVSDWTDIISVAAANQYTFGLKSDGTVVSTGAFAYLIEPQPPIDTSTLRIVNSILPFEVVNKDLYPVQVVTSGLYTTYLDGTYSRDAGIVKEQKGILKIAPSEGSGCSSGLLLKDGTVVLEGDPMNNIITDHAKDLCYGGHYGGHFFAALLTDNSVIAWSADEKSPKPITLDWKNITRIALCENMLVGMTQDDKLKAVYLDTDTETKELTIIPLNTYYFGEYMDERYIDFAISYHRTYTEIMNGVYSINNYYLTICALREDGNVSAIDYDAKNPQESYQCSRQLKQFTNTQKLGTIGGGGTDDGIIYGLNSDGSLAFYNKDPKIPIPAEAKTWKNIRIYE